MAATSEDGNDIEITDNVLQRDGVIVPSFPHEDYQIDSKENSSESIKTSGSISLQSS